MGVARVKEVQDGKWCEGERLIFVGGPPRSGTTLLQNMLDSHPQISGGPEFDHVPNIVKLRELFHASIDSGRIDCYFTKSEVDREFGAFIENLLYPYATRKGSTYVSEKTPMNSEVFSELLEIFPKARFLYCVRDPRAVASSMLEVGVRGKAKNQKIPFFTKNIYAALKTIRHCNDNGFKAASMSDRVLMVSYEEAVGNPDKATREICSFLKIPWSESMVRPGESSHDGQKAMVDGVWYSQNMFCNNPDVSKRDSWKTKLSPLNRVATDNFFSNDESLRKYGFDFDKNPPFFWRLIERLYRKYNMIVWRRKFKMFRRTRSDYVL